MVNVTIYIAYMDPMGIVTILFLVVKLVKKLVVFDRGE